MEKKTYVLDTSALLAYPDLPFRLEGDPEVIIPMAAVKELQGLRYNEQPHTAQAAETVLNTLNFYRGGLIDGVTLPFSGAILKISEEHEIIDDLASDADNKIVGTAIFILRENGGEVVLLSRDNYMRVVARAYGLTANFPYFDGDYVTEPHGLS